MNEAPNILIIGGGIAGISSALSLLKFNNFNITLLEASDRLGGRIKTIYNPCENYPIKSIELGAQWIHGTVGNPLFSLAVENNFFEDSSESEEDNFNDTSEEDNFVSNGYKFLCIDNNKVYITNDAKKSNSFTLFHKYLSKCEEPSEKNILKYSSVGNYVKDKLNNRDDIEKEIVSYAEYVEATIDGDYLDHLSLSYYGQYKHLIGPNVMIDQGLNSLLDKLIEKIQDKIDIKYNHKVSYIRNWNNSKPSIICSNGSIFNTDIVICTYSLGVLQNNINSSFFQPKLPDWKISSINNLGFGVVNKVYLFFDEDQKNFWDDGGYWKYSGLGILIKKFDKTNINYHNYNDNNIPLVWTYQILNEYCIVGWIPGEFAKLIETLSDNEILENCCKYLQQFSHLSNPLTPRKIIVSRWYSDSNYYGSYSYIHKNSTVKDIYNLAKPIPSKSPRIFFAGEATHSEYYSTMHGAYFSGERVAKEILNLL